MNFPASAILKNQIRKTKPHEICQACTIPAYQWKEPMSGA